MQNPVNILVALKFAKAKCAKAFSVQVSIDCKRGINRH